MLPPSLILSEAGLNEGDQLIHDLIFIGAAHPQGQRAARFRGQHQDPHDPRLRFGDPDVGRLEY